MQKKLLLLDDDAYFHRVVASALKAMGLQLFHAYSLKEADAILADTRMDVLVVDSQLPDGEGDQWLVGRRAAGDQTPVVFVSAFRRVLDMLREHAESLRVALLVSKPIVPTVFASQIRALVGQPSKSGAIARPVWLDDLRAEYSRQMPGIVRGLRGSVERARRGGSGRSEALREALLLAHRLHGTAGSYGFSRVSEAAGRLEEALTLVNDATPVDGVRTWTRVDAALADTVSSASADAVTMEGKGAGAHAAATTGHVLIVASDAATRGTLMEAARQELIETHSATTVGEALVIARVQILDGAVIDTQIAADDRAFALVRELRSMPNLERLPIAFVASDGTLAARVEAVHAGGSLYLKKPLDADTAGAALRDLVHVADSGRSRALIIDDDPGFAAAAAEALRQHGVEVRTLADPKAALHALEYFRPDVVLADVVMPSLGGLDLCRIIRQVPTFRTLPVLLVSSKSDVDTRIEAFMAGADDYIVKPLVAAELVARVRGRLDRQRLLRDRAERDSLTGLLRRGPALEALRAKLADANRRGSILSVVLCDLDDFKMVNDTHGHLAGDRVLATLGRLLGTRFRGEDVRARWGGEELVLGFPHESPDVAEKLVERALRELSEIRFHGDHGETFHVTFSAGVASFPDDGLTIELLLRAADRRLYKAKQAGKRRVIGPEAPHNDGPTSGGGSAAHN